MIKVPDVVKEKGPQATKAFLMILTEPDKPVTKVAKDLGIDFRRLTIWRREDNWDLLMSEIVCGEAVNPEIKLLEKALKLRQKSAKLAMDMVTISEMKLEELIKRDDRTGEIISLNAIPIHDSEGEITGWQSPSIKEVESLSKVVQNNVNTGMKATGADKMEKLEIASAGKSVAAIQINVPKGLPEGEASRYRLANPEPNLLEDRDLMGF